MAFACPRKADFFNHISPMQELVRIKNFTSRFEAEMQKKILEGNGIRAVVNANDLGGYRPDLILALGGVWLLVAAKDAENARQILADWS
jgi:hypothetical protein